MDNIKFIYFSAKWCGPCKQFKPFMESLEKAGFPVYFQDVDEDPVLAESYQIRSVPSIKIVQDDKVQETLVGVQDPDALVKKFNLNYPLNPEELMDKFGEYEGKS